MKQDDLDELALRKLLQRATDPQPPEGSTDRLRARIQPQQTANVLAFRPRLAPHPNRDRNRLLVLGMSLAAAMLLGIFIGNANSVDALLPSQTLSADAGQEIDLDAPLQIELTDDLDGGLA